MRWIQMPLAAALLSCAVCALPAQAAVKKISHVTHTSTVAKAAKPGKTSQNGKTSKAGKAAPHNSKTTLKNKPKSLHKAKSGKQAHQGKASKHIAAINAPQAEVAPLFNDAASERVYDGVLPTAQEKIVMESVKDERGRAECVQLLKSLMDAPRTLFWKEGRKLKASWDSIRPGTAIATFKQGRYPQSGKGAGSKHAAIFLRASAAGIYVFDQFAGKLDAEERFIPWHHPRDKRASNNAATFSTVRW